MRNALSLLLVVGVAGCPGAPPPNQEMRPDASFPDTPPGETTLLVIGQVMDYFGQVGVQDALLETDGLVPPQTAFSAGDGGFSIEVAIGSKLYVVATKPSYRPTRSQAIDVTEGSIRQDVFVTSEQDVKNQYTAVGAVATAGTGFVAAELRRSNGQPLDGIPLTNIKLVDDQDQPIAGVKGPYAFNASGNVDQSLTSATTFGGRSRIALLDVPPGTHLLAVTSPDGLGGTQTVKTSLTAAANGSTLVVSGATVGVDGGVMDPSFATHIYPKLQRAAQGGLGCANCHTLSGPAAVLKFDDPATTVLTAMQGRPNVLNATTPEASLLLLRPLYEQPPAAQDHPNATFLDANDPDYKLFLRWITNGAKP